MAPYACQPGVESAPGSPCSVPAWRGERSWVTLLSASLAWRALRATLLSARCALRLQVTTLWTRDAVPDATKRFVLASCRLPVDSVDS